MKLRQLLENLEITKICADLDSEVSGICYDSRTAKSGDVFVAVRGYESDGHKYIPSAVEKGAGVVVCEEMPTVEVPYVLVSNSRRALSLISANFFDRPAEKMKIIGITGTNGKTTTTSLVKAILEDTLGAKVGLIGTNQNMIGDLVIPTERTTPESYELQKLFSDMAQAGCTHVVMEVSSHALVLDRVCGVYFDVAAFTNLTQDHLDFHVTMDEYARAKSLVFQQSRIGIVNADDPYAAVMQAGATCPMVTLGVEDGNADYAAKNISLRSDGVSFCVLTTGKLVRVKLGIPGQFSVYNALTALCVAVCAGVELEKAAESLAKCHGVMGRAEVVPTGRDFTMLIDYAHTPDALENILRTAKGFAKGRVVALFGCGGDRDRTKRPIMGKIAADMADFVIVTSDNPRTEVPSAIIEDILEGMKGTKTPYTVIENRREAIGWAIEHAQPEDVVILAGKGHETYQILGKEKIHFDEREVIAEYLKK